MTSSSRLSTMLGVAVMLLFSTSDGWLFTSLCPKEDMMESHIICPVGWRYSVVFNICFKAVGKELSWQDATTKCQQVTPNKYTSNIIDNMGYCFKHWLHQNTWFFPRNSTTLIWIGVIYSAKKNRFVWFPSGKNIGYVSWLNPMNGNGSRRKECVLFDRNSASWLDEDCDAKYSTLCEIGNADACKSLNGRCEDVCLRSSAQNRTCACRTGYYESGDSCRDIDECKDGAYCAQGCNNTMGGFQCYCKEGYRLVDGTRCEDVNECEASNAGCVHRCINNKGSYTCQCLDGHVEFEYTQCNIFAGTLNMTMKYMTSLVISIFLSLSLLSVFAYYNLVIIGGQFSKNGTQEKKRSSQVQSDYIDNSLEKGIFRVSQILEPSVSKLQAVNGKPYSQKAIDRQEYSQKLRENATSLIRSETDPSRSVQLGYFSNFAENKNFFVESETDAPNFERFGSAGNKTSYIENGISPRKSILLGSAENRTPYIKSRMDSRKSVRFGSFLKFAENKNSLTESETNPSTFERFGSAENKSSYIESQADFTNSERLGSFPKFSENKNSLTESKTDASTFERFGSAENKTSYIESQTDLRNSKRSVYFPKFAENKNSFTEESDPNKIKKFGSAEHKSSYIESEADLRNSKRVVYFPKFSENKTSHIESRMDRQNSERLGDFPTFDENKNSLTESETNPSTFARLGTAENKSSYIESQANLTDSERLGYFSMFVENKNAFAATETDTSKSERWELLRTKLRTQKTGKSTTTSYVGLFRSLMKPKVRSLKV